MSHQFEETGNRVGGHLWTTAALLQNSSLTTTSRNTIEIPEKTQHIVGFGATTITTQMLFGVWEKAATTDLPLPTSRIFKISSDRFGFTMKICP